MDHQLFGVERIRDALLHAPQGAQGALDAVNAALKAHIGHAKPSDDQTMLAVRRRA